MSCMSMWVDFVALAKIATQIMNAKVRPPMRFFRPSVPDAMTYLLDKQALMQALIQALIIVSTVPIAPTDPAPKTKRHQSANAPSAQQAQTQAPKSCPLGHNGSAQDRNNEATKEEDNSEDKSEARTKWLENKMA